MGRPKSPTAWFRKAAEECGGRKAESTPDTETWQFSDGGRFTHHKNHQWGPTGVLVRKIQERYSPEVNRQFLGVNKPGQPVMDLTRLKVSNHAIDRWAQMRTQADDLDFGDMLLTLRAPERVVWREKHDSWLWVRERLAVPVVERDGQLLVTTVLWSTTDMWEQHPRASRG